MNASLTPGTPDHSAPDAARADDEDQPPSPRDGVTVELNDTTGALGPEEHAALATALTEAAGCAVEGSGHAAHEIRVSVVDDERMSELHRSSCGIDGPTDVLTFDLRDAQGSPLDVDVIVCLDVAERAASDRGHSTVTELALYGLHGVLHCLGYDDHDDAGYAAMHRREDEILRQIGLGPVFSPSPEHLGEDAP